MLFLFKHWLSEQLRSSCVSLHFSEKLSHFKRKQVQLRTSHSGSDCFILNAAHCDQGEEQMGHSSCEPIICCLISRVEHVFFFFENSILSLFWWKSFFADWMWGFVSFYALFSLSSRCITSNWNFQFCSPLAFTFFMISCCIPILRVSLDHPTKVLTQS